MSSSEGTGPLEGRQDNQLYQYSLIHALMAGVASSGIPLAQALRRGDMGLGTFTNMRGELIILDGIAYRMAGDGSVGVVDKEEVLPYVLLTHFRPQHTEQLTHLTRATLDEKLARLSANHFVIFKLEAVFKEIACRTVVGQKYKGETLVEVNKEEQRQRYSSAKGTVLGIYSPEIWHGIGVGGPHMHFIDDERCAGGHVLSFECDEATLALATSSHFHIELPPPGGDFDCANLQSDKDQLTQAESNTSM